MAPTPSTAEDPVSADVKPRTGDPASLLPQVSGRHHVLDGIRAGACLMVLVVHVSTETGDALAPGPIGALLSAGELAVPLFFALSAVLLYQSEEHTSELQSRFDLVCRLLLEKKNATGQWSDR